MTVIIFLDTYLHVIVSCSCADFKYRWEVALNHKQAADVEYSNGELPIIRNPLMRPAQCKHLVALYNKIKDQLPRPKPPEKGQLPIGVPEVQVPPSELKRRREEEEKKRKEQLIKPVKITQPKNVQRSVKPGKKQSTLPKSMQKPPAMKAPTVKAQPPRSAAPPAMMRAPAPKSAPKPVAVKPPPAAMRAPSSKAAPGRANRGPASKGRK